MDVSRYVNTEKIDFTVEFLTPCFLGGADQNAEVRVAPFKAGLRYWWRVLYGQKYGDKLKSVEDEIFGTAKSDAKTRVGKSRVIWEFVDSRIDYQEEKTITSFTKIKYGSDKVYEKISDRDRITHAKIGSKDNRMNILNYLALGKFTLDDENDVNPKNNKPIKKNYRFMKPGSRISFNVRISSEKKSEIIDALKFFIMFGGVGGKSRNGFGSMYSKEIDELSWSGNVDFSKVKNDFPGFSKDFAYLESTGLRQWDLALTKIGEAYRNTRISKIENKHHFEKRGLIARPIIPNSYDDNKRSSDGKIRKDTAPFSTKDRIPKNFYIGVRKEQNDFIGYILILPINFYEDKKLPVYKEGDYEEVINKMIAGMKREGLIDNTSKLIENLGGTK